MPINIPSALPARKALEDENIFVMTADRAYSQDIRPLEIAIVNLMPTKIATETQLLRLLSNSPLQVNITLLKAENHISKNTSQEHLERFYTTFSKLQGRKFDGMIITGAPVEQLSFEQVDYWDELKAIMEYSKKHVFSTLHICWGAQAGLYYHYGIEKHILAAKKFGVFLQQPLDRGHALFRGFDDAFYMPHSRHTETRVQSITAVPELNALAASDEDGISIVGSERYRQIFVTGHFEYDAETLGLEYTRDISKGLDIAVPCNYYTDDDPQKPIQVKWRSNANLFFNNWLNFYIYQDTPFDLNAIGVE